MDVINLSESAVLLLLIAALLAGFIDTLVGGGGLITIPALMAVGVPPIFALGTNKLQAVAGSGAASIALLLRRKVSFNAVKSVMLMAFLGSLLGSVVVQFFDASVLNFMIPIVIIAIAIYFVMAPTHSLTEREPTMSKMAYRAGAVPGIGFYDGMFGPGTGSFFVLGEVMLRGQPIVNATVIAKTLNFATNIASLLVFVVFGKVLWLVGGTMMIGQFIGASLGARVLLTINPAYLRYLVIGVCITILLFWGLQG